MLAALALALSASCGGTTEGGRVDVVVTHPDAPPIAPFDECTVTTAREPAASAEHRTPCSEIDYPTHPPSAGPHYSQWAAFRTYDAPVPWGFLVHALEHGAVVIAYRCDEPCPEIESELAAIVAERAPDPLCRVEDAPTRLIVVPDPTLVEPIAAVAWEHVYTATCLDPPSLRAFLDAHYGRGPEDLCIAGVDRSATGWCPSDAAAAERALRSSEPRP